MAKGKKTTGKEVRAAVKTEAVTVRVSPTAKWALELMSRQMHQSISGVFEWCIDMAGRFVEYPYPDGSGGFQILELAKATAEDRLAVRCAVIYTQAPNLLNHDELTIAKAIDRSPELKTSKSAIGGLDLQTPSFDFQYLSDNSDAICAIARGLAEKMDSSPITRARVAEVARIAKE